MYVCIYGFYDAYNYSGLVRQVSGFVSASVSAQDTCHSLHSTGFKGEEKPCSKARETTALRRGIQKASRTQWDRTQAIGALAHGFTD